jgi:hypothetical protein
MGAWKFVLKREAGFIALGLRSSTEALSWFDRVLKSSVATREL